MSTPFRALSRRLIVAAALASAAGTSLAQAAGYPNRPVTVVVPFAPGGSVDAAARLTLQALGERLKQPFVVENVAGASVVVVPR